ncbi:MAG: GTP cyclohydrolase II [Patescibacteria group bacterium]|nr:GTP cyclohydrolase II [Patescibacteria group bacterium]
MKVASASLPTKYGLFKILVFKSKKDNLEHVALVKGEDFKKEALVRIHSRCLTGDVFSSLRCDCHEQLQKSLQKIGKAKNGVLIYLNQEGRGIGLVNKIKAYALQEAGLDTVQANEQLGFTADTRSYEIAAQILKDLNIQKINLLTNNPDKINQLEALGITITKRIPLETIPNKIDKIYLMTKKNKFGHKLKLV